MRWKHNRTKKKPPFEGQLRVIHQKFLFIPKRIKNEIRWLEYATYMQLYKKYHVSVPDGPRYTSYKWVDEDWLN